MSLLARGGRVGASSLQVWPPPAQGLRPCEHIRGARGMGYVGSLPRVPDRAGSLICGAPCDTKTQDPGTKLIKDLKTVTAEHGLGNRLF